MVSSVGFWLDGLEDGWDVRYDMIWVWVRKLVVVVDLSFAGVVVEYLTTTLINLSTKKIPIGKGVREDDTIPRWLEGLKMVGMWGRI